MGTLQNSEDRDIIISDKSLYRSADSAPPFDAVSLTWNRHFVSMQIATHEIAHHFLQWNSVNPSGLLPYVFFSSIGRSMKILRSIAIYRKKILKFWKKWQLK